MSNCFVKLLIMLNAMVWHQTTWNPEIEGVPSNLPYPFFRRRPSAAAAR